MCTRRPEHREAARRCNNCTLGFVTRPTRRGHQNPTAQQHHSLHHRRLLPLQPHSDETTPDRRVHHHHHHRCCTVPLCIQAVQTIAMMRMRAKGDFQKLPVKTISTLGAQTISEITLRRNEAVTNRERERVASEIHTRTLVDSMFHSTDTQAAVCRVTICCSGTCA